MIEYIFDRNFLPFDLFFNFSTARKGKEKKRFYPRFEIIVVGSFIFIFYLNIRGNSCFLSIARRIDRWPRAKWNLPRSFNLFAPGINYSVYRSEEPILHYYLHTSLKGLCNARWKFSFYFNSELYVHLRLKRRESVVEIAYRKSLFGKSTNMLHYLREINFVKSFLNFVVNSIYQEINYRGK